MRVRGAHDRLEALALALAADPLTRRASDAAAAAARLRGRGAREDRAVGRDAGAR